jgi:outer membrane lipoprotein SlyB
MSILSKLFGGGGGNSNPMDAASQYTNQIPGVAHQGYDPYIEQGKTAGQNTNKQYEDMMNDPTGFINKLMEQYKTSEGYGFAKDKLTKEMSNTSAAGGIAGTPQDQMNQAEGVQGLLSKDMQQFLQNALGRYDTGLQGEQGIANRGYDASGKLTDTLGSNLNQQGTMAFNNSQQNQKNKNDIWSMFGKGLGGAIGGFAGGGPLGAALGGVGSLAGPMSGSPYSSWNNPG